MEENKYIHLVDLSDYLYLDYRTVRQYFRNYQLSKFYNEKTRYIQITKTCINTFDRILKGKSKNNICKVAYERFQKYKRYVLKLSS